MCFLIGAGLQVSGVEDTWLAPVFWGVAGILLGVNLGIWWEPVQRRFIYLIRGSQNADTVVNGKGVARIQFYAVRDPAIDCLTEELDKGEHVSLLWHSGGSLGDQRIWATHPDQIDRLLLIYPDPVANPGFRLLAEAAGFTEGALCERVKLVTKEALAKKIDVRWRKGLPGNLIAISDSWVLVENFFPFVPSPERPGYRFAKEEYPQLYVRLRDSFNRMWKDETETPPPYLWPSESYSASRGTT
jgi:hypothetical protein